MPQINLTALSGPDLRQLLDASRRRGDAALSYKILEEMAARRDGRGQRGLFLHKRPADAKVVAVDLGEPEESEDDLPPMPHWRAPELQAEPEAEPEAAVSPSVEPEPIPDPAPRQRKAQPVLAESAAVAPVAPAAAESPPPEPPREEAAALNDWDLRMPPSEPDRGRPAPRKPRKSRSGFALGLPIGAAAGIVAGWYLGGIARDLPSLLATPVVPIQTAALAPTPAPALVTPPAAEPEPAPEAPAEPAAAPPPTAPVEAAPPPPVPEVAQEADAEPVRTAEEPRAVAAPASSANACAAQPTPADREICAEPQLRELQRELRRAYAEALEAHEDRALLRQRQLAWATARDPVSDPDRLVALYEERIRRLNAATEQARQQR